MKLIGIGDDIFARIGIRIGIESGLVCIYFSVDQDKNNEKFISELVLQEFRVSGYVLTPLIESSSESNLLSPLTYFNWSEIFNPSN